MANEQHIQWLLEGVESWNSRFSSRIARVDLEGEDIQRRFSVARNRRYSSSDPLPLANIELSFANLKNASLHGADLRKSNLLYADLRGADLAFADLSDANLISAKIDGETNLFGANLIDTNLSNTYFGKAILHERPTEITPELTPVSAVAESQITSVSKVLEICEQLDAHYKDYRGDDIHLYYRGEDENTWDLKPSVMRVDNIPPEGEMLLDLISRQPQAFHDTPIAVEQWILAQHYTLRTRLLDITKSPLVALYNSCHKQYQKDGAFHIFAVPKSLIKPFGSDTISVIANFAKLTLGEQDILSGVNIGIPGSLEYHRSLSRLYNLIRHEKPFFEKRINPGDLFRVHVVEPRHSFDRIRAQAGAFLLSAYHRQFEPEVISDFNKGIPLYNHYKLTVPSGSKPSVMRDLERIYMTRETLFPGLDESAKAVNERFFPALGS